MPRPVRRWDFTLNLAEERGTPLFRRISRAIVAEIERGRLRPGSRLPGTRTLARTLLVNRNTVLAAYEGLTAEGWLESSRASATFVSRSLPDVRPPAIASRSPRHRPQDTSGFDVTAPPIPNEPREAAPDSMLASAGIPDARLAPAAELARAYRRVLRHGPGNLLSYGFPHGHPRLRAALAAMLGATRGLAAGPEDVVVTAGSQMALELVSRALLKTGDVVVVEDPGYPRAWPLFKQHGARVVPIAVDGGGLDTEALAALARKTPIRAVYVTPHHQYPTTATLAAGRRIALLDLARRLRIAVIEDDYDHEYHYDGRPVLPLASADRAQVVIYVGSLAKVLAPGVRLGYVTAPRPLLASIAMHRACLDRQGDHAVECAVAELLEQGVIQRHARRAKRIYRGRRDFLVRTLRRELGSALTFDSPAGGVTLWARVSPDLDADRWASRACERGVMLHSARHFAYDGQPAPYLRLSFAQFTEEELERLVQILRATVPPHVRASQPPARGSHRRTRAN
jgi:GntR family transcriptional regulator / MocR family aminotransferase